MMRTVRFFAVAGICLIMLSALVNAAAPTGAPTVNDSEAWEGLTPAAIERVKKGEIVIADAQSNAGEGSQTLIRAAMIVKVPIQEAYRIIRQTEKQYEYVASSDENRLIERTKTYDIVEFTSRYAKFEFKYRVKHQWNEQKFQMWWSLDPTFKNDVKVVEGYWHLFYIDDNTTLIRYGTRLVAKEFIPSALSMAVTRHDLPNGMEDVRKRIESHGTYKRKGK